MLALDPPDAGGATIGGIVAANDSGPLRARYGGARDLVVGMRVALADGTVAKSGGKVIKNVAGYDLAKLFTGSLRDARARSSRCRCACTRCRPATATARRPHARARTCSAGGAAALSHARLEQLGLDVRWAAGRGHGAGALRRRGGARRRPRRPSGCCARPGLEAELRRGRRRRSGRHSARASARPTGWSCACRRCRPTSSRCCGVAERHGATLVGPRRLWAVLAAPRRGRRRGAARRAARALRDRRARPPGRHGARARPAADPGAALLARRVKERFDPNGTLV